MPELDIQAILRELVEELSPAATEDSIGDLPVKVVAYDDLIRLKELAGRTET